MVNARSSRWTGVAVGGAVAAVLVGGTGLAAYAANATFHGNPYAGTQFAFGLTGVAVGTFVALRRPDHPLGWLLMLGGGCALMTFAGSSVIDWMIVNTHQVGVAKVILHLSIWGWIAARGCTVVLAPLAFPDGWPKRRLDKALWVVAGAAIVVTCAAHARLWTFDYFNGVPANGIGRLAERILPWGHRAIYVLALVALAVMVARLARLGPAERRGHLPFAAGIVLLAVPSLNSLLGAAFGHGFWNGADSFEVWALVALPVVLAAGILRHHLLDIDVVVRRTTVYALVTALAVAVYVAVVSVFSVFVQHGSGAGPVVATGVIAIGVLPAHAWAERFVAHRLFGNRGNPYQVITALGARLEQAPPGDQALQLVADTLREQLAVPFAAVEVAAADTVVEAAASGTRGTVVERFPLVYQGEPLGSLVVAHRSEREAFGLAERELLSAFARQAGVVAHNAALSHALLQSRAVLVQTREEERGRIRRDLHDGLGPTLATVSLSLGAAAERLHDDAELAALLRDLEGEVQLAIGDIRRLVYDLRPPVLDDLGLVGALRGQAAHLGNPGVVIDVEVVGSDSGLPSVVELAAYRVAVEAMTNVVRHAKAGHCLVAVERDHQLVVRVEDDGIGIREGAPRGVGLRSMRERVVELGGSLRFDGLLPQGTRVRASFPLEGLS